MNYRERPFDFMGAGWGVGLQDDFLPQHDLVFLVLIEYNTKCTIEFTHPRCIFLGNFSPGFFSSYC